MGCALILSFGFELVRGELFGCLLASFGATMYVHAWVRSHLHAQCRNVMDYVTDFCFRVEIQCVRFFIVFA